MYSYDYDGNRTRWRRRCARLAATTLLLMLLTFSPFQPPAGPVGGMFARAVGAPRTAEAVTLWDGTTTTQPTVGDGSQATPYKISTGAELAWIASSGGDLNAHYILSNDVYLGGKSWTPIGSNSSSAFTGTFDGGGCVVYGLAISNEVVNAGLFGYAGSGAEISDLYISGCELDIVSNSTDGKTAGALVGYNGGTVERCGSTGSVRGANNGVLSVGGLVGQNAGTVSASGSGGAVVAASTATSGTATSRAGGLVGYNSGNSATITRGFSAAAVSASTQTSNTSVNYGALAGGLVGANENSATVERSGASGNVYGSATNGADATVGGLVGYLNSGAVRLCSASGNVDVVGGTGNSGSGNGRTYGGGLIGSQGGSASATSYSHSSGSVSVHTNGGFFTRMGCLIGYVNGGSVDWSSASGNAVLTMTGTPSSYSGGLTGQHSDSIYFRNCYVYGKAEGGNNNGALIGGASGTDRVLNCVWRSDVASTANAVGNGTNSVSNCIGLTGTEMQNVNKFIDTTPGWSDFNDVWCYTPLDQSMRPHLKAFFVAGNTDAVSTDMLMAAPLHVVVLSNDLTTPVYVNLLAAGFEKAIDSGINFDTTIPNVKLEQHATSRDVIVVTATGAFTDDIKDVKATFAINGQSHEIPFTVHLLDAVPASAPGPNPSDAVTFSPTTANVSGTVGSAITPVPIDVTAKATTTLGTMTHGTLPGGITVAQNYMNGVADGTITISGTPTAAGNGTFTITVANSAGATSTINVAYSFTTSNGGGNNGGDGNNGGTPGPTDPTDPTTPEVVPPDSKPELGTNGEVSASIPVKDTDGNTLTVVSIPQTTENNIEALAKLSNMGLTATVVNGAVQIGGTATDIGTVTLDVTITDSQGETKTTTVTVTIEPLVHTANSETQVELAPSTWTGELTVDNGVYRFTLYVPVYIARTDAVQAKDVAGTVTGGTVTDAVFDLTRTTGGVQALGERGADAQYVKVTGTTSNPDNVYVRQVTYRLGIHKYVQAANVKLIDADIDDRTGEEQTEGGGSSSGCSTGTFGLFALLAAGIAIKRRR